MKMRTSSTGILFIKGFEGFSSYPYKDVAGFLSIGYGHRLKDGEHISSVSDAAATGLLRADLLDAERAVNSLVIVPLNQNQFDALVSFTYNVGIARLRGSTLLRALNGGNYALVVEQFGRWVFAGGQVVDGLRARRADEAALFARPMASNNACATNGHAA